MKNLETSELKSVVASLISLLDDLVASAAVITFSTRAAVVEERITPALTTLQALIKTGEFPELVTKGQEVMSDWARLIVASPTGWWIYTDRLQRQARSLRLIVQVRTMGKLSRPL